MLSHWRHLVAPLPGQVVQWFFGCGCDPFLFKGKRSSQLISIVCLAKRHRKDFFGGMFFFGVRSVMRKSVANRVSTFSPVLWHFMLYIKKVKHRTCLFASAFPCNVLFTLATAFEGLARVSAECAVRFEGKRTRQHYELRFDRSPPMPQHCSKWQKRKNDNKKGPVLNTSTTPLAKKSSWLAENCSIDLQC